MGRIPLENNCFISRDTQTHPYETAMMKGNIILEMDIYGSIYIYYIISIYIYYIISSVRLKNQLEVYYKQAFDSYVNLPQDLTITTSY